MSHYKDMEELRAGDQATLVPTTLSRSDRLALLIEEFERRDTECFRNPLFIELGSEAFLRRRLAKPGTSVAAMADILTTAGIPTARTMGAVMDALELSRRGLHAIVCGCHHRVSKGYDLAGYLRRERFISIS